jgi:hypothetical protein
MILNSHLAALHNRTVVSFPLSTVHIHAIGWKEPTTFQKQICGEFKLAVQPKETYEILQCALPRTRIQSF